MFKKHTHYKDGQTAKKSRFRLLSLSVSLLLIASGVYLLLLLRAPSIKPLNTQQQQEFIPEQIGDKQLIIPKIAVNVEVNDGDLNVLNNGAWHRLPELGNPHDGGNFIVSAHRYVIAKTPEHTKEQSYFYNIDKLEVGDEILVDWRHERYKYKVSEINTVSPTQLSIESPSTEPIMTLYTCTLKGSKDGRVVIIAKPAS